MRTQRRQPTRLPCPWDSPGKNTGVGCHFLLQCMKVKVKSLNRVRFLVTPWTAAYQAPPSMGFSRQEYWSGVPLPSLPFPLLPRYYSVQPFLQELQFTNLYSTTCSLLAILLSFRFPGQRDSWHQDRNPSLVNTLTSLASLSPLHPLSKCGL